MLDQGTARSNFPNTPYTAAGKTGTAEVVYYGPIRNNGQIRLPSHAGFAPYENPEVAYAVIIPWHTSFNR